MRVKGLLCRSPSITEWEVHITAQSPPPRLQNDLYCVEWDVVYHTARNVSFTCLKVTLQLEFGRKPCQKWRTNVQMKRCKAVWFRLQPTHYKRINVILAHVVSALPRLLYGTHFLQTFVGVHFMVPLSVSWKLSILIMLFSMLLGPSDCPCLRFNVLSIDFVHITNCFYDYDYY